MENSISRKFTISIIAILVLILATNNFSDLTGQPVKSIQQQAVRECYDSDGYNYYRAGYVTYGETRIDECNGRQLNEWVCSYGLPDKVVVDCKYGCESGACKNWWEW